MGLDSTPPAPGASATLASGAPPSSAAAASGPLRLPAAYDEAKEQKVQSVANLRAAVKSVRTVP